MSVAERDLAADAVETCAALIRFDTSNYGDGRARGEREAADWVADQLRDGGYAPVVLESAPGRASTLVRIPGRDRDAPGLLVHGHLDVVPAEIEDWSVDPFGGEVRDGAVWGRGALDMKGTDAMMLAVARGMAADGFVPARDLVLAFVADEEDTGRFGAGFIVEEHPELLAGVGVAIGESGGDRMPLPDGSHLYPVATAERGTAWMTLTARGPAGHGSRPRSDNAVATLAAAVSRIGAIEWPVRVQPALARLLAGLGEQLELELDPADPDLASRIGAAAELVETTLTHSLTPTMLAAGTKANVVPAEATAVVDGRILPGYEEEFFTTLDAVLGPEITRAFISHQQPISADPASPELALMQRALSARDPAALVLPCCAGGGSDAKWWSRLGIACYGFAPELAESLAPGEPSRIHGVDERITVESLSFGVAVLDTYLRSDLTENPPEEGR